MKYLHCFSFVFALILASCSRSVPEGLESVEMPFEIFAKAPSYGADSKMLHEKEGLSLFSSWEVGDRITVANRGRSSILFSYVAASSGPEATFTLDKSINPSAKNLYDLVYYPGGYPGDMESYLYNDYSYTRFSFANQVQEKDNPTAHLSQYHTMRMKVSSGGNVYDFSRARQASCLRMRLSGMTFQNPSSVEIRYYRDNLPYDGFPANNWTEDMKSDGDMVPLAAANTNHYVLGLSGYGAENTIDAYMMMPDRDFSIKAGDKIRIIVTCSDDQYESELTFSEDKLMTGGHCHILLKRSGWSKKPEYDKQVVELQKGNNNLQIVLMGDGYTLEDIERGQYDADMRRFYSYLFNIEPYATLKDDFSVKYVTAVSNTHFMSPRIYTNGADNNPEADTRFNVQFKANSTWIDGERSLILQYANKATQGCSTVASNNRLVVVIANLECRSGTCYMTAYTTSTDYGYGYAVALLGKGRSQSEGEQLLHHEAMGHGFGKLADEYGSGSGGSSKHSEFILWRNTYNHYRNVDIYNSDWSQCYWADLFNTENNYESREGLGFFLGGKSYKDFFGRPTENGASSIMNKNTGNFNAQCRRQIYYRYKGLTNQLNGDRFKSSGELNDFLEFDRNSFLKGAGRGNVISRIPMADYEDPGAHTPPVLIIGDPKDLEE